MFDRSAHPASFDSASVMVRATAHYLRGAELPMMGNGSETVMRPVLTALNRLPSPARRWLYAAGSGRERLPQATVARASADGLARQVVGRYPRRRYGTAVVGSNPGSMAHLAAALGAPLLPQTLLLPVARHDVGVDDPFGDIAAVRAPARELLDANPDLALHQMMDPNFDRLTLRWFSYFRLKFLRLGPVYERFLLDTLEPGATLFVADCTNRWPVRHVGDRHWFQFGGVGGAPPEEYVQGSPRVAHFLGSHGSPELGWSCPQPDDEQPEAEWGTRPELAADVERFAAEHGFRVRRLRFEDADDASPFVADLHRWWYARHGLPTNRLFAESFALLDPWLAVRTGTVPFWCTFNGNPAADAFERYLERTDPYDFVHLTLISHGTTSIGLAPLERWRGLLRQARVEGRLSGVDEKRFPADLAVFARWREAMLAAPQRFQPPPALAPDDVVRFWEHSDQAYEIKLD